jgi:glutamate racemase
MSLDQKNRNLIAIFDSGSGGLITLNHLIKKNHNSDFLYFADLKNMPYGEKTKPEIQNFTIKIIDYLEKNFNPDLIVNACNTSFGSCIDLDSSKNKTKILNIADCFVGKIDFYKKKILIMSTPFTNQNKTFEKIFDFHKIKPDVVYSIGFPRLAFLAEKFLELKEKEEIEKQIELCLFENFKGFSENSSIDFLIYGCSHYPHLDHIIQKFLEKKEIFVKKIIDPSIYLVDKVCKFNINQLNSIGKIHFIINGGIKEKDIFQKRIEFFKENFESYSTKMTMTQI